MKKTGICIGLASLLLAGEGAAKHYGSYGHVRMAVLDSSSIVIAKQIGINQLVLQAPLANKEKINFVFKNSTGILAPGAMLTFDGIGNAELDKGYIQRANTGLFGLFRGKKAAFTK